MYFVSFGAVRRRAGQSLMMFILAGLLATVAAAAPWYGLAAATRAAQAHVSTAPIQQKVLLANKEGDTGGDPRAALDAFGATVGGLLPLPGARPVAGIEAEMRYVDPRKANVPSQLPLAYRDDFCAHARLTGKCPSAPGEVALTARAADAMTKRTGDTLPLKPASGTTPLLLRITAIYEPTDPVYWSDPLFLSHGDLDAGFTTLDTFRQPALGHAVFSNDVVVPEALLRGDDGYDLESQLDSAKEAFSAGQITLSDPTDPLLVAVYNGKAAVARGVLIPLGLVVVLGWFAFALAGRFTGRDRREDAGLLKLRGSTRGGIMRLATGQHLVPLIAGAVAGMPLGFLAGWLLAGRLPVRTEWWLAVLASLAAVLIVLLGGLLALTLVDTIAHRAPVVALLRRVPATRGDWRSLAIDVAFVALAVGAAYQARSGGPANGLGVAAPALVALAVALILARLLRGLADRAGGAAVRAGRLRAGLTAVRFSRQPGTDRVFALVVVSVAVFALSLGGLLAGRAEQHARAEQELGADRVLTVSAATRTRLLDAVRHADPSGRYAMAAVVDSKSSPPILAVDTTRLAAVTGMTFPAAAPPPAPLPLITGRRLELSVTSAQRQQTRLGLTLQHEGTGAVVQAEFTHIRPGANTVSAAVPGCATAPGCRLVNWDMFAGPDVTGSLTIHSLTQQEPSATVLDSATLADASRWRTDFTGLAVQLATDDGLKIAPAAKTADAVIIGTRVYAVDTSLPLPLLLAGPTPSGWRFDDATLPGFGAAATAARIVGRPAVLPVVGRTGVMADLDSLRRLGFEGGTFQVWLASDAPASVVRAIGLPVLDDRTVAGRAADLAAEDSVVTAQFGLFTVGIAVLLAAAMVAVGAAVEQEPQAEQLRALRVQGLSRRAALSTAYAGSTALVLAGLAAGVLAALVARPLAGVVAPAFADGWDVLPPPGALGGSALLLALLFALAVLGVTAWLSALPLIRRLR
ncbi:ABC transporter permease [Actinoplanes sp. TBRC 11911]|uniref:FtsX-like permease family protein n=1 Tax=Actinoplanes sp. TBRC 11911 TaxID=2729386 RepID=UPI00145F13B4|nr:FtsX-like permease family protein [Actinoplanes sp. TBRC 11911]NMO57372.1 ABC transporter permease [Actinoplanes sp. TBRC 11911]